MNLERRMRSSVLLALSLAFSVSVYAQDAAPTASADETTSIDSVAAPDALSPGEYEWYPERSPSGQMVIVVSLPQQRLHVYRNGVRIGVSTISSGRPGNETPTGTFEILEKQRMHHSNLYDSAPMPFMQRLTWDGVALHAGRIPGHPASHGCVRLPADFARTLFEETERGTLVVIADELSNGAAVVSPGDRAPVDTYSGAELPATALPTSSHADDAVVSVASP